LLDHLTNVFKSAFTQILDTVFNIIVACLVEISSFFTLQVHVQLGMWVSMNMKRIELMVLASYFTHFVHVTVVKNIHCLGKWTLCYLG